MLQRIYGTAWFTKDDLEGYLRRLEEAKKRDQPGAGKQLDLFSIQEEVGPGLVFWHPKGAMIQHQLAALHRGHDSGARLFRWSTRPA